MDDSSLVVDEFSSEIETDYFNFYNVAVELTQEQEKHVDEICLSCATDIAGRERVSIVSLEGQKEGNDILIYTISKDREDVFNPLFIFKHKFKLVE